MLLIAPAKVEGSSKLLLSRKKHFNNKLGALFHSGQENKQDKMAKERMSQSYKTKIPSHYVSQMSNQQQKDSRNRKYYVRPQEKTRESEGNPSRRAVSGGGRGG